MHKANRWLSRPALPAAALFLLACASHDRGIANQNESLVVLDEPDAGLADAATEGGPATGSDAAVVEPDGDMAADGGADAGEAAPEVGRDRFLQVSLGPDHACALRGDRSVACWGWNNSGRIGDGTASGVRPLPTDVVGLGEAVQVSAGFDFSCAVLTSGEVHCWGRNDFGQLARQAPWRSSSPLAIEGVAGAVSVAGGGMVACAVLGAGQVACWGDDPPRTRFGRPAPRRFEATVVPGLSGVAEVSVGANHVCARLETGAVYCWGGNDNGQVGDGTRRTRREPVPVAGLDDALQLSAGNQFSCVVRRGGAVACWGHNSGLGNLGGLLGDGTRRPRLRPVAVRVLDDASHVSAGNAHACAVRASGEVWCWGLNATIDFSGHLGIPGVGEESRVPRQVPGIADARAVTVGACTTCVLHGSGQITCWGSNDHGELGIGSQHHQENPVRVQSGLEAGEVPAE